MTIGGVGEYIDRENAQNFVQLIPKSKNSLQVDSQILHAAKGGIYHLPFTVNANISSNDLIIQGKLVDENNYQLIFNNGVGIFKYNIPADNNFIEDVNGLGCLGFGAIVNKPDEIDNKIVSIVVKEINGVAMTGKESVVSTSPTSSTNTTSNTISDKTNATTSNNSSDKNPTTSDKNPTTITSSDNTDITAGGVNSEVTNVTSKKSNDVKTDKNPSQNNEVILIVLGLMLLITNIIIACIILIKKKILIKMSRF